MSNDRSQTTKTTDWANDAVSLLHGVGTSITAKLQKLGITTIQDLLFHLPLRYEDRTHITPLQNIKLGQQATIEGVIERTQLNFGRRRSLTCTISDGKHYLNLRFFHFSQAQQRSLAQGQRIRCFGEVRYQRNNLEMVHPEYRLLREGEVLAVEEHLTPIYPTVTGLHQLSWRKMIVQALTLLQEKTCLSLEELLPLELLQQRNFPDLLTALSGLHHPPPDIDIEQLCAGKHPYQQRLAFEELLAHHLSLRQFRHQARQYPAMPLPSNRSLVPSFMKRISFDLTTAQKKVVAEIQADLDKARPMMRLVQGDVGSGKTIVAALAALSAIENNQQVVLMAPTELLAEQHYQNFQQWLQGLDIELAWLSGSLSLKNKRLAREQISSGQAKMIIGTHAIFQQGVIIPNLALLIIDEQHRFGVHQRLALKEKGLRPDCHPHQLIMTATPIPRTLAMSAYADLDISTIDELPPGRTAVSTAVINNAHRHKVIDKIRQACVAGRQVYWVCTLIEESEQLQAQAAENVLVQLQQQLPEIKISLVHGRMKRREKEQVMASFKAQQSQLLVATTVIEVGVDVPNASLMVIENAERLGLSQLHQLRGRVGRGETESYCLLLYQAPLSSTGKQRLDIMRRIDDGFKIAEQDLKLRGPGEVLGTKQTGICNMRVASLIRDRELLPQVKQAAEEIIHHHPQSIEKIIHRWLPQQAHRYVEV